METLAIAKFIGAAISVGVGGLGAAVGQGICAHKASEAMARQPAASAEVIRTMLLAQAVAETSGIFCLMVAVILLFVNTPGSGLVQVFSMVSAGICMGFGSLGSGFGSGMAGGTACTSVGRQPRLSSTVTLNLLIGQAISQTPSIFALVIAMMLMFIGLEGSQLSTIGAVSGAGICMGIGSFGPGFASGYIAERAMVGIVNNERALKTVPQAMLLGQAVAQSTGIFALVISFVLLIV